MTKKETPLWDLGRQTISTRQKKKTHLAKRKQICQIEIQKTDLFLHCLIFCRIIHPYTKPAKWT